MHIQPIETYHNNYLFRSRLEARWAVFFDTLGIKYRYETEGFVMGAIKYLPDFWLVDQEYWIEIKPKKPTSSEIIRAGLLAAGSGQEVFIFSGDVWNGEVDIIGFESTRAPNRIPWYVETAIKNKDIDIALSIMERFSWYYWDSEIRYIKQYLLREFRNTRSQRVKEEMERIDKTFQDRAKEPYWCSLEAEGTLQQYEWVSCTKCNLTLLRNPHWIGAISDDFIEAVPDLAEKAKCPNCKCLGFEKNMLAEHGYIKARTARFEKNRAKEFTGKFKRGDNVYHSVLGEGSIIESRMENGLEMTTIWFFRERKQLDLPSNQLILRPDPFFGSDEPKISP